MRISDWSSDVCSSDLPELGIPTEMVGPNGMEFWNQLSFLKAGISYSDRITTVSKTYAKEILTEQHGNGLDGVLNKRKNALTAIPNGVDLDVWNPITDTLSSEEHTSELQTRMRTSYTACCSNKKHMPSTERQNK